MSISRAPNKDPNSTVNYGFDWSDWLANGESIVASDWLLPGDLSETSKSIVTGNTTILLSGGVAGEEYVVTNRITTNLGQTEDRSMLILCTEK